MVIDAKCRWEGRREEGHKGKGFGQPSVQPVSCDRTAPVKVGVRATVRLLRAGAGPYGHWDLRVLCLGRTPSDPETGGRSAF